MMERKIHPCNNNRIKYLSFGVFCIVFLCLHACTPSVNKQLQEAERLIKTKPDSAFHILDDMQEDDARMNDAEQALFGYLYLRIRDGKGPKDSVDINRIDFSIDYYRKHAGKQRLAGCYLYKARIFKDKLECTEAVNLLLKAKDIAEPLSDHELLGEIYFDLGHIAAFLEETDKALQYFDLSIKSYERCGNTKSAGRVHVVVGWLHSANQDYEAALQHTMKAMSLAKDSLTKGNLLEDIGDYHLANHEFDSAYDYFQESLLYPSQNNSRAIRYYGLAKLFFETGQYDSAKVYIDHAMSSPMDISYKANCYQLLAGIASATGTKQELERYMIQYQLYQDSVNQRKRQPRVDVVEKIHRSGVEKANVENHRLWLIIGIAAIVAAGGVIFYLLYKRNRKKQATVDFYKKKHSENRKFYSEVRQQADAYKAELKRKHAVLLSGLKQKLDAAKEKHAAQRKAAATQQEREAIDKAVYNELLQIDNEQLFTANMNRLLNDLPQKLQNDYPGITYKQIVWCCLFVLEIFTPDIALIMEYTPSSLYKFKQRLSQKLGFNSVKELEQMLYEKAGL